jgi:hypothetical protein
MRNEARARRAVRIYLGLCFLAAVPLIVVRSEAAASWSLLISLLALPWTRVAGILSDRLALAPWAFLLLLTLGAAINAVALYWILGGRFRPPDV